MVYQPQTSLDAVFCIDLPENRIELKNLEIFEARERNMILLAATTEIQNLIQLPFAYD